MRFHTKQRPRGIVSRRDQRRMMLLIVAVGVVIVGMKIVSNPGFWTRFFPDADQLSVQQAAEVGAAELSGSNASDSVGQPAGDGLNRRISENGGENDSLYDGEYRSLRPIVPADEGGGSPTPPGHLPEDLLRIVRDDVIGVFGDEKTAYFAALRAAGRIPKSVPFTPARFATFMDAADSVRGIPLVLTGKLRRLEPFTPPDAEFGLQTLYDAWISLPDSGAQLVHVVVPAIDSRLKPAEAFDLKEPPEVRVRGYFFKREAYGSQKGLSLAPLILGDRLSYLPRDAGAVNRADELTPWLWWLTVGVCGTIGLVFWLFYSSDHAFRLTRAHALTQRPAAVSFDEVESEPIPAALQRLADQHENQA